ncbi:hypothetical protein BKA83DRAFT_26282 [Pisolithus microcarpus]|nr:hypothetical protein BKA83DRAFT_26282 [Pisolithus microcarpus]
MLSTLEVDLRPGSGIGMFELGSSLWFVMAMLRNLQHLFPQVEVKFDAENASTTPVILHLRPHFDLLFSGYHQRLHTICLRKITDLHPPIILRYKDSCGDSLVKVQITRAFGPTYPGDELRYPGVWFSFEDDAINEGLKGGIPNTGPDQRSKEVKRIIVTQKDTQSGEHDALDEVIPCPVMFADISQAIIKIHHGIVLHFFAPSSSPLHICLGKTTVQDLNLDLGPPSRVFYKEDGHFYNYFHHGIDFLISGQTHRVRKIILHSNVRYKRCPWELEGRPEDDEDDTPPRMRFPDKFEAISHFLNPRDPPPQSMILDRTDDDDTITLPSPVSRLYGYSGVILEVNEASQVVAVTLF